MGTLIKKRNPLIVVVLVHIVSLAITGAVSWASSGTLSQQDLVVRWNPRRVPANTVFLGDEVCAQCHKKQSIPHAHSSMGQAMEPVPLSKVLTENPALTFKNGPYSYSIKRQDNQSLYTVTDGKENISLPILYAVGHGKAGQTYLLEYHGEVYESLVSFYGRLGGLDFTLGHSSDIPSSLKQAIGRPLTKNELGECFGCHSTGGMNGGSINLEKAIPGIRCEACHGPGGAHVTAIQSGEPSAKLIFNPSRLSGDQLSQEFCASCHRGSGNFEKLSKMEINNVRFQPYRIFYSKCYSDDRRIGCTACHNPHEEVNEDVAYYDAKCAACHSTQAKQSSSIEGPDSQKLLPGCPVANKDCVSCHMPKVEPPGSHFKFADHYIRIVKRGEAYPN